MIHSKRIFQFPPSLFPLQTSFLLLLFFLISTLAPAHPSGISVAVKPVVQRGLQFLEKETISWKDENKCASCHHVPMMIWAFNEAKAAGYSVHESVLSDLTQWALNDDEIQHVFPGRGAPPETADGVNLEISYMVLATEKSDLKVIPDPMMKRFFADLSKRQSADGSWICYDRRLPVAQGPDGSTLLTRIALTSPLVKLAEWEDASARIARADAWIANTPVRDANQDRNLRLLLAARLAGPASELQPMIDELRSQQNEDGGWSEVKGLPSDAYGTGQTIYALNLAGVGREDPAVIKAVRFLIDTQKEDGSWPAISYQHGVGKPGSNNMRPMTNATCAWGVIGLSRATPRE